MKRGEKGKGWVMGEQEGVGVGVSSGMLLHVS